MEVTINCRHFALTEALEAYLDRKIRFAFSRIESELQVVSIVLGQESGATGKTAKHCAIQLNLANMQKVVITETQADLYQAIDRAMHRASYAAHRKISRRNQQRKRPFGKRELARLHKQSETQLAGADGGLDCVESEFENRHSDQ